MRVIELDHDGDWLVLRIAGLGRLREGERQAKIKRVYLRRDEAAMVVSLLTQELGAVEVREARPL